VLVQSLGTVQGETFFGMPSVQSVLIPFSLPELTRYKAQVQSGYMRYSIDLYDAARGRLIRSTPWYAGSSYYNQYTLISTHFSSFSNITPPVLFCPLTPVQDNALKKDTSLSPSIITYHYLFSYSALYVFIQHVFLSSEV
jgi:hypothetical protein